MTKKTKRMPETTIDRLGRETYINLYLLSRRFTEQVEKVCRSEKIAMSHYAFLWFLSRRHTPEGVPMGAVVDGHLNRASDATRLADRLTDLGYVERLASPSDRRVVLVRITDAGRDVFVSLTRQIRDLHREQWQALDEAALTGLNATLSQLLWGDEAKGERHPLLADPGAEERG